MSAVGLLAAAWLAGSEPALAQAPIPPAPTRWVTDEVSFLSPLVGAELDGKLEAYERQTGHQVIVWIGASIGGADLADWAVRTFEAWQVGQAGLDDGLVVFVLAEDRLIDIEVGYGLEDRVPDAVASRIIREEMVPRLQVNDRDGAIRAGVDALLTAIEGHPVELGPQPGTPPQGQPQPQPTPLSEKILLAIGILLFLLLFAANPRLALWLLWSAMSRGGGRGGEGGDGGFQGGGGRSGGGGARGSW